MIDARHWCEGHDGMTVLADVCRQRVRRRFAYGCDIVVAVDTAARDVVVVEVRGRKCDRRVAVVTSVTAWNVVRVLADGRETVMAGATSAQHLKVIDCGRGSERNRRMAILAEARRRDMRGLFTCCANAVMATGAVGDDSEMVEKHWEPGARDMT